MPTGLARCQSACLTAGVLLLVLLLGGCAAMVPQTMGLRDGWPAGVPVQAEIAELPFYPQVDYQCGPAALATALVHAGARVTPDELVSQVYLPARQGSLQVEMLAASRRHGMVSYPLSPRFDALLREVAAGHPVIVLQDNGIGPVTKWHYAVVAGFDYPKGELYLRSGETRRLAIPFTVFEYTWKKSSYWAMVALPPGRIPVTATEAGYQTAVGATERVAEPAVAARAYPAMLERWPGNEAATVALANQHHARGELEQAQTLLRRALQRHPDSVVLLNNLAQTLSDLGRNDEALALIGRITLPAQSPFAAAVGETRAQILQRLGRAP